MSFSIASFPIQIHCKGILFDMDGILISSIGSVERSWTKWATMRGIDPERALRLAHGRRSVETIAELRPDLDVAKENLIIEGIEMEDTEGVTALPGVLEFLSTLPQDRWTVVTSATEPLARVRLAAGNIPVPERIVTADDVSEGKPHPAPYLAGAALLGFAPEECTVFEDAAAGATAGRAAGCTVIATTFSHSIESLRDAHFLIPDITAVAAQTLTNGDGLVLKFTPLSIER
ncbi:MAG TPA: HAD-IA family hydrolase [Terracidiphilus sp.]|jgi:sugar-phosphatase|nr:HAD-IA family hydrolase [Terracidiphilus sp.]